MLPALVFIGIMGWLMYALEPPRRRASKHQPQPQKPKAKAQKDDGVTFIPAFLEEEQEIVH